MKPKRHVLRAANLDHDEAFELGGLLQAAAAAVEALLRPDQVYLALWSHTGSAPVHIHWVVQPVTASLIAAHRGLHGPQLQAEMFNRGELPVEAEVEALAAKCRHWFDANSSTQST